MPETTKGPIHSVAIACNIINVLKESDATRVTEIADRLGHSKSTVHDHLQTLEQNKLVVKKEGRYRLSIRLLDIAEHVRNQIGNYEIIRDELNDLAAETGENVQFGIEEHGKIGYFYKASGDQGVQTASSVGTFQPMHSTALGKSILANLSEDRVYEIVERHGLPAMTENTITDIEVLLEELEQVREQGYAIDDEENLRGLRCVSAPVMDGDDIFGAVSVSGPSSRFSGERLSEELPETVKSTTNVIELNSKYS